MPGCAPVMLRGAGLLLAPARVDDFKVSPPPALRAAFLRDYFANRNDLENKNLSVITASTKTPGTR